jgi:enamine deaminase RidA (YjgF/YER057c/UK114 family)
MCAHRIVQPDGWPEPKGYANGIVATGRTVWIAGQVGHDASGHFAKDLVMQTQQTLRNVLAVLTTAGATPEQIVRMTWFLVDITDYKAKLREIGIAYRSVMGRHYPAMTAVEIKRLVESEALIEIEATAVLP